MLKSKQKIYRNNCIICEKEIPLKDKRKTITCCKECSKIYTRVQHHIRSLIRNQNFKKKK